MAASPRTSAAPKRRRLGLRARATVAFGAISLALSGVLAVLAYEVTRSYLLDQRSDTATAQAYANARFERSVLRASPPGANVLDLLPQTPGSVDVVRYQGEWFANTIGFGADAVPASLRDAVAAGDAGRQYVRVDGDPFLSVGVPLPAAEAEYFELVSLEELERTLSTLARVLTVGALGTAVAGAVVGRWAAGRVLRPLREVAATAEGITEGATSARLGGGHDPDLAVLVRSFNGMVDALEARVEREAAFAADVSHELRSPLAAMTAALDVARRHLDDPQVAGEALDVLEAKAESFSELVAELLEMSRLESGTATVDASPVPPDRLARSIVTARERPVDVRVESSAPPVVVVDQRRVAQILTNLLDNADRYAGGATALAVSGIAGRVRFAVEDNGPGVPEHEREYIFERFARGGHTREASPDGTGLGLSLVAEHVRLLRGRVWVEDSASGGARFVIELPAGAPS